jgi:hypothetical protein
MNQATKTCPRCKGEGIIKHFSHVRGGICFKCKGAGLVIDYSKPQIETEIPYLDFPPDNYYTNDDARLEMEYYDKHAY